MEFQAVLKASIENGHKIAANTSKIDQLEQLIVAYNKELKENLPKVEANGQLAQLALTRATNLERDEIFDLSKGRLQSFTNAWAVFESKIDQRY